MDQHPFIVTIVEEPEPNSLKGFPRGSEIRAALVEIPIDKLSENLNRVCSSLLRVLADIKTVGDFELAEVEIGAEITAEGGVEFIGTSKVGAKGAVKLRFSKPK